MDVEEEEEEQKEKQKRPIHQAAAIERRLAHATQHYRAKPRKSNRWLLI